MGNAKTADSFDAATVRAGKERGRMRVDRTAMQLAQECLPLVIARIKLAQKEKDAEACGKWATWALDWNDVLENELNKPKEEK